MSSPEPEPFTSSAGAIAQTGARPAFRRAASLSIATQDGGACDQSVLAVVHTGLRAHCLAFWRSQRQRPGAVAAKSGRTPSNARVSAPARIALRAARRPILPANIQPVPATCESVCGSQSLCGAAPRDPHVPELRHGYTLEGRAAAVFGITLLFLSCCCSHSAVELLTSQ